MTHEEAVMENLLLLEPRDYTETQMMFDGLMSVMKDLWVRYQGNVTIATVVVNILMRYLPLVTWLSHDHQTFVLSLINHQSNDIKRLVMKLWINLVEVFSNEQYITQCLQYTVEVIYSTDHALRVECLNLIGRFCHLSSGNNNTWLLLVTEFCLDPDSRVRKTAIMSLLAMHEGGVALDVSTYRKICGLLNDPDEYVRFGAIKLVHTIGTSLVDSTIGLPKDDSILMSLHDDAFSKLCGCVTDSSVRVRAYAAQLLGEFPVVGERFLLQTLDKKLMSHLQVVKSDHQRRRELHHKGGGAKKWDTGKQWGGDIPHIDPLEVTLMSSGSCGAFVHCIEDEYMEVRGSAIRSIGNLSSLSTQFCLQSLDFLIDMINDEIQSVRLLAIVTLRKVSSSINLREDQLESILGVLQESSLEIREALHSLLASSHVTSKTGLHSVVHSLLDNLSMYPSDRLSIWNCLKALGVNHAHLVAMLSLELLSLHPYYMSKEPDINDNAYVSVLILIFNAASVIPTLTPLFPAHVFRHYHCTRDSLPHLIPPIKILAEHPELPRQPATPNSSANYLKQLLSRGLNLATSHSSVAMATLKQCCDDLNKLSTLEPSLNGCGLFSSQLLYCQVLMSKIEQVMSHSVMGTGEASEIAINIHEVHHMTIT
jgi:integrator complex subunit 4